MQLEHIHITYFIKNIIKIGGAFLKSELNQQVFIYIFSIYVRLKCMRSLNGFMRVLADNVRVKRRAVAALNVQRPTFFLFFRVLNRKKGMFKFIY